MTLETWLGFMVAAWLISLSPGPGAVSAMASAVRFGFRRSLFNFVGLQLGLIFVLVVVAIGLGAVVVASSVAFTALKWLGVAYLVYLGLSQFRSKGAPASEPEGGPTGGGRSVLVWQGFLVNASNPKGIVFMLAVLPQFIDADRALAPQYAICGLTLMFTDLVVMNGYGLLASKVLGRLKGDGTQRWLQRVFGGLYLAAAGLLATFGRH